MLNLTENVKKTLFTPCVSAEMCYLIIEGYK